MKVLIVCPEIRLDNVPYFWPFWAGILAAIVEQKGGQVAILDLNALRTNYGNNLVPSEIIKNEISSEKWDIIGIGGLTTTYRRIKELVPLMRKCAPNSLIITGGGWSTYNPDEILQLVPEVDLICIGEGEETFSEIYDKVNNGNYDFENVKGLCLRSNSGFKFTEPRALISDLNTIPYPAYHLYETDIYFKYSSLPLSVEAINSKRRASVVWERGCPRRCTFCSHNGMSRIDLQNIYGNGDVRRGEEKVRIVDKANDTFQLPARWPSPEYAVENIKFLR
jgi:anaerobic magnesium-protoporphyrin IX monomethyl ester cyclase